MRLRLSWKNNEFFSIEQVRRTTDDPGGRGETPRPGAAAAASERRPPPAARPPSFASILCPVLVAMGAEQRRRVRLARALHAMMIVLYSFLRRRRRVTWSHAQLAAATAMP